MSYRPKGKHVSIDPESPEALGICDYSGFVFKRKDLVRQMEWRGNALVWTGFYVGLPYVDVPNEQLRPPILPPDPVPVKDPRLPQTSPFLYWNDANIFWNDADFFWNDPMASFSTTSPSPLISVSDEIPDQLDVPALPEEERLIALQTYNWGL